MSLAAAKEEHKFSNSKEGEFLDISLKYHDEKYPKKTVFFC